MFQILNKLTPKTSAIVTNEHLSKYNLTVRTFKRTLQTSIYTKTMYTNFARSEHDQYIPRRQCRINTFPCDHERENYLLVNGTERN